MANFLGQLGSSGKKLHIEHVEKKQREVGFLQEEARRPVDARDSLREKGEADLTDLLVRYEGLLIQVRRIKEKLTEERGLIEVRLRAHYKGTISSQP